MMRRASGRRAAALLLVSIVANTLPAEPPVQLGECLAEIGRRTGARIVADPGISLALPCRGLPANGAIGTLLDAALAGTDLAWRARGDGLYVISSITAPAEPARARLETLTIEDTPVDLAPRPQLSSIDAALASTRYERDELAARALIDADQISRLAPNLYGAGARLSIRGVERDSDFLASNTIFLDGIDVGSRLLRSDLLPLEDLERITIQRGPRTSSDGSAVMGGKIALETADPPPETEALTRIGVDKRGRTRAGAVLGGALGASGVSARLAADLRQEAPDVNFRSVPALAVDSVERRAWLGKLLYEPEAWEGFNARFTQLAIEGELLDRLVGPFAVGPGTPNPDRVPDTFDSAQRLARRATLDANASALGASYAGESGWQAEIALTRTLAEIDGALFEAAARQFPEFERELRSRHRLEAAIPIGARWNLLLGGERFALDTLSRQDSFIAASAAGGAQRERFAEELFVDTTSVAALAERSFLDERAALALGARLLRERVRYAASLRRRALPPGCGESPDDGDCAGTPLPSRSDLEVGGGSEADLVLPVLAASWRLTPRHVLTASYDSGYRSGGVVPGLIASTIPVDPERSATAQLGWRAEWDEGLETSIVAFYQDWYDRQIAGARDEPPVINGGRSHAWGAEFEARAQLAAWLRLRAGLGLLRTEFDRFRPPGNFAGPLLDDFAQPKAPEWTAITGVQWIPPEGWYGSLEAYRAGAALASAGSNARLRIDPYTVVDARVGWRNTRWDVSLSALNLLDEFYVEDLRADAFGSSEQPGVVSYVPGEPRRVVLRVSYRW
jgi:outer membrane receptor protein involved in Fe transport